MSYVLTTDPAPRMLGRARSMTANFFAEAYRPPQLAPAAPHPAPTPGIGHNNPPSADMPGAAALAAIREAMHAPAPTPDAVPVIIDPEVIQAAGDLLGARKAEKKAKGAVEAARGVILCALSAKGVSRDGKPVQVALAGRWRITAQHSAGSPPVADRVITADMVGQVIKGSAGRDESWRVAVEAA